MDELSKRRLAHNEQLFREVNEQVEGLREQWGVAEGTFVCECSDQSCTSTIVLGASEYERIRARPNWFFLLPGHERVEVEQVVEQHGGYFVVEKPTELITGPD